jgi:hypothetical protein
MSDSTHSTLSAPSSNSADDDWVIRIRLPTRDIQVPVQKNIATVDELLEKTKAILEEGTTQTFKIRLIHNGKMLAPPDSLLSAFGVRSGSYVHAMCTAETETTRLINTEDSDSSSRAEEGRSPTLNNGSSYLNVNSFEFANDAEMSELSVNGNQGTM